MEDEQKFGSINQYIDLEKIKKFQRLNQKVRNSIQEDFIVEPKIQVKQNKIDYCQRLIDQSDMILEKDLESRCKINNKLQQQVQTQKALKAFSYRKNIEINIGPLNEGKKKFIQSQSLSKSFENEKKQRKKKLGFSFQAEKYVEDPAHLKRKHYLLKSIHQIEIEHQREKIPNRYDGTFQRIYIQIRDDKKGKQITIELIQKNNSMNQKHQNKKTKTKRKRKQAQQMINSQKTFKRKRSQKQQVFIIHFTQVSEFDNNTKDINFSEIQRIKKLNSLDKQNQNRQKILRDQVVNLWFQKRRLSLDVQQQNQKSARNSQETFQEMYQQISNQLVSPNILRKIYGVKQRDKSSNNYQTFRNIIQQNMSNTKKIESFRGFETAKNSIPTTIQSNDHDIFHQLQDIIQDIETGLQK